MSDIISVKEELRLYVKPEKVSVYQRFFKTGPGQYGEGDVFIGITVPDQRKVARKYRDIPLENVYSLLDEEIHEYRLTALLILVEKYNSADENSKEKIVNEYCKRTDRINNWDLVDLSAHKILGPWFLERDRSPLYDFARSGNLWKERIAVLTTYHFIKNDIYDTTLEIAEILLHHDHDLIHKAVGWMLREIGKRSGETERNFLKKWYREMPRTMLRYAIEKFPEEERQRYLKGTA